jgi:pSer/pThr/pTyr-binding forkhead associated (FHA) protein
MTKKHTPYLIDPDENEHLLEHVITRLGRAVENEIVITSKKASREHAIIKREGRKALIEDQASANGTLLNGERISGAIQLRDGDAIEIGGIAFIFRDPDTTTIENGMPLFEIDRSAGVARVNRRAVQLSPKEFALAGYLDQRRGKVCSKDEIGQAVWAEYQSGVFDYQIENLVRRLRTKIENDPNEPQLLITVRGLGYKLNKT